MTPFNAVAYARRWVLPLRDRRHWLASSVVAAVIVVASTLICGPLMRLTETARIGSASGIQFETAVNWVLCGRFGAGTSAVHADGTGVNLAEIRRSADYEQSVRALIAQGAGSVQAYCAERAEPMSVEEAGMMLVDAIAIRVAPDLTLHDLARVFAISRLVCVWLFAWYLLESGYSMIVTAAAAGIAVYFSVLLGGDALYSEYPFILPVVLAGVAIAGWSLRAGRWLPVAAFALGVWAALVGNLRTSHYPLALAIGCLFLAYAYRRSKSTSAVVAAIAVLAFVAAPLLGELALRRGFADRPKHHSIAHPLVLGVGNPPNDLSRREGIEWSDAVGWAIARRFDSNVVPGSEEYERIMFRYYRQLWQHHPLDMMALYRQKLSAATEAVFNFLSQRGERPGNMPFWTSKSGRFLVLAALPIRLLSRWLTLGVVFTALFCVAFWRSKTWRVEAAWPVLALSVAGVLAFLEAAIILGGVTLWYNAVLIFATTFTGLLVFEGLLLVVSDFIGAAA